MKKQSILIVTICLMLTGCGSYDPTFSSQDEDELLMYIDEAETSEDFQKVKSVPKRWPSIP